jgi:hypothetical protein
MKIETVMELFYSYQDRFRDEGYTNYEASVLLNVAQEDMLKYFYYNMHDPTKRNEYQEPRFGFETISFIPQMFDKLIIEFGPESGRTLQTDRHGYLLNSVIEETFPVNIEYREDGQKISEEKCQLFHINSASRFYKNSWYGARHMRQNDYVIAIKNPHKRPTDQNPFYRIFEGRLLFEPRAVAGITMSVTRQPKKMWYFGDDNPKNVDPELSDFAMGEIIKRASFLAMLQNENFNKLQALNQDEQK